MSVSPINITIGTAGHIDHGKTALVKNLTGCDTDYLKEEKERGMSIELGFAPCEVANLQIGIVDVPGHEHFIRAMVAGAASMDGVIFVVAADDGVMPQSREHLDILTLLGVKHGIIALTKCDRVGSDELELVTMQVRQFVSGTFLENAPILPISNVTGQGYDSLIEALKTLVAQITPKPTSGLFRMPIEKVFSIKGYGTVVTGIPVSGSAMAGQEVVLEPHAKTGRIKTVQVYSSSNDYVKAGQCAAINIPQLDHSEIVRGNVLVIGDNFAPSMWYVCKLRLLANGKVLLKNGQQIKFHTGTSDVTGSVYIAHAPALEAGHESIVQIKLERPIVAGPKDRFIIRHLSPVMTIGGGTIIEAIDRKQKGSELQANFAQLADCIDDDLSAVTCHLKRLSCSGITAGQLAHRCKLPQEQIAQILETLVASGAVISFGQVFVHRDGMESAKAKLLENITEYHRANPQSPGINFDELLQSANIDKTVFEQALKQLLRSGKVVEKLGRYASCEHQDNIPVGERLLMDNIAELFKSHPFDTPNMDEICRQFKITETECRKIIKLLLDRHTLVMVEKDMLFHADAVEGARQKLISYIQEQGGLESVQFKYLLNTSRKYAIPLLDYFDRIGLTKRSGYTRLLK